MSAPLPINAVLPQITAALGDNGAAVLIAPPGAGKTTAVAPALLSQSWCSGQIILTSPRRVAARAAAERMAQMLGERVGETIGYQTRMDSKVSARTRVRIVTEALLVKFLVDDPELTGISAILLDEAHERHLDCDCALAMALEARGILREDLRILVMSATIDGARFAALLGKDAPLIESEGKSYPLEIRYLGRDAGLSFEEDLAGGVMHAWREHSGDILAFAPGLREIARVCDLLRARLPDVPVLELHGQIEPADQRAAIRRDPEGRRRIVIASAIAETSLTLDGVNVVVDGGLSRLAEFDRAAGVTRLVTRPASQASAAQRAGRAARQSPGTAYRLWNEASHRSRAPFAPPEIETADLSGTVLALADWGAHDMDTLGWIDPPPKASLATARASLRGIEALDDEGRITARGRALARLPMAPADGAALLAARGAQGEPACLQDTAQLIMLMQERGLGGRSEDLAQRLARFKQDGSARAKKAHNVAAGWAKRASSIVLDEGSGKASGAQTSAEALALSRPGFLARRRDPAGERWASMAGRGYALATASPLASAEWIVICDAQGDRIVAGLEVPAQSLDRLFAHQITERSICQFDPQKRRVNVQKVRQLGAITLLSVPDPEPDPQAVEAVLMEQALGDLDAILPRDFLARLDFASVEGLSRATLVETAELWLAPVLKGRRDLDVSPARLAKAALGMAEYSAAKSLDERAPLQFATPAGTQHPIDYGGDDAPSVEVRVQAMFGLDSHPMIGETPLLLKLTSPAGRPIQSTRDLPGFWRGSWADVAKGMKGRYPKHRWPEEPWLEKPSLKTKNAFHKKQP